MFDVFYIGNKPNVVAHEQAVENKQQAQQLSKTRYCWIINSQTDYDKWDFTWEPAPWESKQTHAWPSQWQRDCGTYLIPTDTHKDVNYHTDRVIPRIMPSGPAVIINHMDGHAKTVYAEVGAKVSVLKTTKFVDNYLDTLLRIARSSYQEYLWILSSVCDYSDFDFTWHPDVWQTEMLHVFQTNECKFGDTFYMHVPTFLKSASKCELLDWYNNNFTDDQIVPRRDMPVIEHEHDSHADAVKHHVWDTLKDQYQSSPLTLYTNEHHQTMIPTVPLWRKQTRTVTPLDTRAASVIIPRDAIPEIKTQLYDYAYVNTQYQQQPPSHLDIVFLDNGEVNADENYEYLQLICRDKPNTLIRCSGFKGRVQAYQQAAGMCHSPWIFYVFAKLTVNPVFDFNWQPDCMQEAKHYIFHAKNPINGLEYGHMAMIAYNRKLVLENEGEGLDFTLDQPHEVVPLLSGTANYADDPKMAWRSAFREALKLKWMLSQQEDVDTEYRLNTWRTVGEGTKGMWSRWGANHAVAYYDSVNGDFDKLKLSYEWEWLHAYYKDKYDKN